MKAMHEWPLSHYTKSAVIKMSSKEPNDSTLMWKPRGLWVSVDGNRDWLDWCESESFALDRFEHRHVVKIKTDANVIVLNDGSDFHEFHMTYAEDVHKGKYSGDSYLRINWGRVAKDYDGILIPKYHWEFRLMSEYSNWYYSWDCASGCIWGADAILSIKRDEKWKAPKWRTYEERYPDEEEVTT